MTLFDRIVWIAKTQERQMSHWSSLMFGSRTVSVEKVRRRIARVNWCQKILLKLRREFEA